MRIKNLLTEIKIKIKEVSSLIASKTGGCFLVREVILYPAPLNSVHGYLNSHCTS